MKVTIWGCRGSIASAGPDTLRYGGNTSCVSVSTDDAVVLLDAGTGIRHAGLRFAADPRPIHLLLSHLHMDHIQGLGFFRPLFQADREVHIWGPPSTTLDLRTRLGRYLSPPLFPVRIRDLASRLTLHDVPPEPWSVAGVRVTAATVIHPGPTLGIRLERDGRAVAYLPDHEPALGGFGTPDWTSGFQLASGVDVLIHDGQYTDDEYDARVGWGHSSVDHAVTLADRAGAGHLVLFHHEPDHDDATIDGLLLEARAKRTTGTADAAREGLEIDL